jgi:asparagine synthetase B (glutamine-hydrolysing)
MQATFTFVLLDADSRCLLAARSAADAPPLFWGSAADGALLFASEAEALQSLCDRPTGGAAPFPAGCFYLAADDDRPPQIVGCEGQARTGVLWSGNRL